MDSQPGPYNSHPDKIMFYAADWCPECDRVRSFLVGRGVEFIEVDTAKNPAAVEFLEHMLRRVRLPTIIFPDGTMSVEPSNDEIARHLAR